ncbi:hypothetical protein MTR_7g005920 [Medicago truncatula]|uniref:Uncharacterized protein n=2 Tax=Medicago truncatula TaxID=3880 RepID=G7KWP2_MEDTR|nr:hypothetical protein MTR_7g005920 [Medicago truncatula]
MDTLKAEVVLFLASHDSYGEMDGVLQIWIVCGEVIRNDSGSWRTGFSRNLGACLILMAKHWGILTILQVAWNKGFRHGSRSGAHLNECPSSHPCAPIVTHINRLRMWDW